MDRDEQRAPHEAEPPSAGSIGWRDLTVENAAEVRRFYEEVADWSSRAVPMDGYEDYEMVTSGGECVAGICHARGGNSDLPPLWLVYIQVQSVAESARRALRLGGEVIAGPRGLGGGAFCVIRDPAGAVAALYEPPPARP